MRAQNDAVDVQNPSAASISLAQVPGNVDVQPVELMAEDGAPSRGLLYRPKGPRPKVGVHLMHPRGDLSTNYNILPLAKAGYTVLGRASRWPGNDSATIHEHLLLDVAAGIRLLKNAGCDQVVLLGNSGGSSLAAFYQEQGSMAAGKRLTHTPAGDPFDLNQYELPLADAFVIVGGHVGQGGIMRKLIDPSVVDEDDPLATDSSLDMYDPANGFAAPPSSSTYTREFLDRYEAAQADRVRRIDAKALALVQRQREAQALLASLGDRASLTQIRAAKLETHMIVYRTTAYPAFTDTSIEPDGRGVASYFTTAPHLENFGSGGFGRYVTPRAWLSTWSANASNARTIDNLANQSRPLLIVHHAGDCGTRLSEASAMLEASRSAVKSLEIIEGIDHTGFKVMPNGGRGPRVWRGTEIVVDWMKTHFPLS